MTVTEGRNLVGSNTALVENFIVETSDWLTGGSNL